MRLDCGHFVLDLKSVWDKTRSKALNVETRAAHLNTLKHKFERREVGFFDYPVRLNEDELQRIVTETQRLRRDFDSAVLIGIGGSFLGAAALMDALPLNEFPVHWVSNIDSGEIEKAQHFIKGKKPATLVISKSGNTIETLSAFFHLSSQLDPKGYLFITDPSQGELRRLARELKTSTFDVPGNIGGRFSVLTPVGLVPTALAGIDPRRLIKGADSMRTTLNQKSSDNPACLFAECLYVADTNLNLNQHYLMPYSLALKRTADWYVQLWGESLGKSAGKKRVGPTPIAALGTSDQHSILQLLKEGPLNKVVGFVDVLRHPKSAKVSKPSFPTKDFEYLFRHSFDELSHQACLATKESLDHSGVATYRIEIPSLTPETMGGLFFFFEFACAYSGELYGIDAFGQPGVEDMKAILRKSL